MAPAEWQVAARPSQGRSHAKAERSAGEWRCGEACRLRKVAVAARRSAARLNQESRIEVPLRFQNEEVSRIEVPLRNGFFFSRGGRLGNAFPTFPHVPVTTST